MSKTIEVKTNELEGAELGCGEGGRLGSRNIACQPVSRCKHWTEIKSYELSFVDGFGRRALRMYAILRLVPGRPLIEKDGISLYAPHHMRRKELGWGADRYKVNFPSII